MDHTKLVIFLLIVLGTVATFGSPITEDYPEDYPKDYPEEYSEGPEEYPELSPDTKELDTLRSDPDMGIFHEMAPNRKELEALLLSDPALGNYPEMVPNRMEIEALRMRSNQSNPAIEMTPEFQEQEELLSNSTDQDGKIVKRADPGTVIAGAELGVKVIKSVLKALSSVSRKIAIGVDNESRRKWEAISVYFYSGTSDENMPYSVKSGKALLWGSRKTKGPVVRGAVGVFTYYIYSIKKTLAVMYSVPFDYTWYSNWWSVKLYKGKKRAGYSIYKKMYYGNPFKGDNSWHYRKLGSKLKFKGAMTGSGKATLRIKVYRIK